MAKQSLLEKMECWGYCLLSKPHPDSPGYTGLLIAIRQTPTKKHFDPESISLHLCDKEGASSWMTLSLTTSFPEVKHVCPGQLFLYDRVNKRVDFFTFGGSLEGIFGPEKTIYSLSSPAPILSLTDEGKSIPDQLAFEVEAILGEFQAKWGLDDKGFAQRLAQVAPFQLYLASLEAILNRYKRSPALSRAGSPNFYTTLTKEKDWLIRTGQWPAKPPDLGALLSPG